VPGPRRSPSLLDVVYNLFGPYVQNQTDMDRMVCHRSDVDTSGILIYIRTHESVCILQEFFRSRSVKKVYEALRPRRDRFATTTESELFAFCLYSTSIFRFDQAEAKSDRVRSFEKGV